MANTTYIKNVIEPHVRTWLENESGIRPLREAHVVLPSGRRYHFDAVSHDEQLVANILSNRARTANGNENTGGVRKALNDLQFLGLVPVERRRIMLCTDSDFSALIQRRAARVGFDGIEFLHCSLPPELQKKLDAVLDAASSEQLRP